MNIKEARKRLELVQGDDEKFHSVFDDLLEDRLDELDPEFMEKMRKEYKKSGMARWCS